jgi:hypothetical protein
MSSKDQKRRSMRNQPRLNEHHIKALATINDLYIETDTIVRALTALMARYSHGGFGRWAFATALSRLDRHGRTDMSSAQSALSDHMIVWSEAHLQRVLKEYTFYYNAARTHLGLQKDAPYRRPIERRGRIVTGDVLGGLHHQYCRI